MYHYAMAQDNLVKNKFTLRIECSILNELLRGRARQAAQSSSRMQYGAARSIER